jgi:hypothetical protein
MGEVQVEEAKNWPNSLQKEEGEVPHLDQLISRLTLRKQKLCSR